MRFARSGVPFWMAAVAVLLSTLCLCGCGTETADKTGARESTHSAQAPDFSEEVQAVLDKRLRLIEKLAAEESVVEAVREANRKSEGISEEEIARLDQQWQASGGLDDFVKSLITNECAQFLVDFQEDNDGFPGDLRHRCQGAGRGGDEQDFRLPAIGRVVVADGVQRWAGQEPSRRDRV